MTGEEALLALFAECDAVFDERDRFTSEAARKVALGRIYRATKWEAARAEADLIHIVASERSEGGWE